MVCNRPIFHLIISSTRQLLGLFLLPDTPWSSPFYLDQQSSQDDHSPTVSSPLQDGVLKQGVDLVPSANRLWPFFITCWLDTNLECYTNVISPAGRGIEIPI